MNGYSVADMVEIRPITLEPNVTTATIPEILILFLLFEIVLQMYYP